jgi:hypothetical protein
MAFGTAGPVIFPYYLSCVHQGNPTIFASDIFSGGILFHIGFLLASFYFPLVFKVLGLKKTIYLNTLLFFIWLQTINYAGKMLYIYIVRLVQGVLFNFLSETVGMYLKVKYRDVSKKNLSLSLMRVLLGIVIFYSISYYANGDSVIPEVDETGQRYYEKSI